VRSTVPPIPRKKPGFIIRGGGSKGNEGVRNGAGTDDIKPPVVDGSLEGKNMAGWGITDWFIME